MTNEGKEIADPSRKRHANDDDGSSIRKRKPPPVLQPSDDDVAVVENGSINNDGEVEDIDSGDEDGFSNDEIKIETDTGKIITLKVQDSDTIGSLKLKIQDKECIPFTQQELIYNKMLFDNNSATIGSLGIEKGSILTLVRRSTGSMTIFIKPPFFGPIFPFEVKPSDTIREVGKKICATGHLHDKLIFDGIVLERNGTLADFNIIDGSLLTCIVEFAELRVSNIYVNDTFTGKTISLLTSPCNTIAEVKSDIADENIPCDEQTLIFNNMVLGDEGTLADFHIYRNSTLTLMRKSKGFIRIFIKTGTEETITVKARPSNGIGYVKDKIVDQLDIPYEEMELIFNNMALDDSSGTLADFKINNESTLTLMRISTGFMRVFVNLHTGRIIDLKVKPSYTIYKVKSMIFDKESLPPRDHTLIFNGKKLQDEVRDGRTLADYHIHKESTIDLVPRYGKGDDEGIRLQQHGL